MPKRKRDDGEGIDEDGEAEDHGGRSQLSVRQKRVRFKIAGGVKSLVKAFKLAKGFERQKLGRRHKKAESDGNEKDVARIDAEIAALKAMDATKPAKHHLYKSLMKIKLVAEHPNLPEEVRNYGTLATDTPTLNVNARLCKSNPVKTCMDESIAEIQRSLGLEAEGAAKGKKPRIRAKGLEFAEKREEESKPSSVTSKPEEPNGSINEVHGYSEDAENLSDEDSGSVAGFEDRIASSENEDDEEDEGSDIADLERRLAGEGIKASEPSANKAQQNYSVEADMDISDSPSDSGSDSPEPRKARQSAAAPPVKKSSFIPSLTMGGYISGSDSDIDFDVDDEVAIAPRKNRRGQRARQQIYEKKYGAKARHLQKLPPPKPIELGRDRGWGGGESKVNGKDSQDRRSGSSGRGGRGGRGAGGKRGFASGGSLGRSGAAGKGTTADAGQSVKHRDDSGPIHPSWEAAKRAKEKKDAPVAFQGKKITFD